MQRDAEVSQNLVSLGWKVMTIWECELADQLELSKKLKQFF
jgi:G:T-mismatch repair DNA endonuclease (very short patch repair protein)